MKPLIEPEELHELYRNENLVIIDAGHGESSRRRFISAHLEGAQFVELDSDLSDIKDNPANGGRHPLPSIEGFTKKLSTLGINKNSHVVVYDDKNGTNSATRFWWMLKAVGHQKVQVLNGGFHEAVKAGVQVNNFTSTPKSIKPYSATNWLLPMSTLDEVERITQDHSYLIIDVRAAERYRGETEPIDTIAGHIPGAINIPFTVNLDHTGRYLPPEVLREIYKKALGIRDAENTIVHCGSGVTACHTVFAMHYAGLGMAKLYVGSWSEWSRNNKPIAKENT